MRAVVTGGAGFLGSHLIDYLLEKKYEVVCLDREDCSREYTDSIGVPVVECDVLKPNAAAEHIREGDYVFHLAAYLGKAEVTKEEFVALNVTSAEQVCRDAAAGGAAKFIFPSSLAAMGPGGTEDSPMTEETECDPVTSYGWTKYAAELRIKKICSGTMDCHIFRPPPFYGPRMNPVTSSYILFDRMQKKKIAIVGTGRNYFPLCYVKNLARGMVDLTEKSGNGTHTWILADGPPARFNDILLALRKEFGKNEKIIHIPYRLAYSIASVFDFMGRVFNYTPLLTTDIVDGMAKSVYSYDISKAFEAGYEPAYTLEEGVKETADWLRKNRNF